MRFDWHVKWPITFCVFTCHLGAVWIFHIFLSIHIWNQKKDPHTIRAYKSIKKFYFSQRFSPMTFIRHSLPEMRLLVRDWKCDYYLLLKYMSFRLLQVLTTIVLQLLTAAFDIVGFGLMARHIPFRGESYYYRDTEVNKQRRPILFILEPRHLHSHKWKKITIL